MKFQLFILYLISTVDCGDPKKLSAEENKHEPGTGKLTDQENSLRKENCGKNMNKDQIFGGVNKGRGEMTGTLISSRHVLTSAGILSPNIHKEVEPHCTDSKNSHFKATQLLGDLYIQWGRLTVKPKEAYIICNQETSEKAGDLVYPMLIEIKENLDKSIPCLPDQISNFRDQTLDEQQRFYVFHYRSLGNGTLWDKIEYNATRNGTYLYTDYYHENQRGAGLIEEVETIWKLVGIGAGDYNNLPWFFDIQWILEDLCELAGICQLAPPPAEVPSTAAPSATPEPANSEKSTTDSLVFPGSGNEPPVTMEPIAVIDLDKEYKEFMERQEKESVILDDDDDEWGNDFYMSADFFQSSGKRSELFVGFLMVILVVWRMVMR
ncbi:unnamed protein product [Caenorhabditis brenneri]